MPPFRNRYATIRFAARCGRWLLVTVAFGCAVVWAQSQPAQEQKGISAGLSVEIESELPRAEQDVTLRLEQLEDLQRVQKNLHKAMERDQAALAEAESSGDSSRQRMALESLRWRQEISAALGRRIRTVQLLYDQAVENYRITSERQRLVRERQKAEPDKSGGTLFSDTARRRAAAKLAANEMALAQRNLSVLEQKENILTTRARVLDEELQNAEQRLRENKLSDPVRQSIEQRLRELREEQQAIEPQIAETRRHLLLTRAQQLILEEKAQERAAGQDCRFAAVLGILRKRH